MKDHPYFNVNLAEEQPVHEQKDLIFEKLPECVSHGRLLFESKDPTLFEKFYKTIKEIDTYAIQ